MFRQSVVSFVIALVAALQVALLGACSGSTVAESCGVAGRERSCDECAARQVGIQTCGLNGSWSDCECFSLSDTAAARERGNIAGTEETAGTSSRTSAVETEGGAGGANAGAGGRSFPFSFAGRRSPFPGRR